MNVLPSIAHIFVHGPGTAKRRLTEFLSGLDQNITQHLCPENRLHRGLHQSVDALLDFGISPALQGCVGGKDEVRERRSFGHIAGHADDEGNFLHSGTDLKSVRSVENGVCVGYYESRDSVPVHVINKSCDLLIRAEAGNARSSDFHSLAEIAANIVQKVYCCDGSSAICSFNRRTAGYCQAR